MLDQISIKFTNLVRKKLKNNVKKIILFGSRARGDFHEWSDYDFIVIVSKKNKKINDFVDDISAKLFYESDLLIGVIVYNEIE